MNLRIWSSSSTTSTKGPGSLIATLLKEETTKTVLRHWRSPRESTRHALLGLRLSCCPHVTGANVSDATQTFGQVRGSLHRIREIGSRKRPVRCRNRSGLAPSHGHRRCGVCRASVGTVAVGQSLEAHAVHGPFDRRHRSRPRPGSRPGEFRQSPSGQRYAEYGSSSRAATTAFDELEARP